MTSRARTLDAALQLGRETEARLPRRWRLVIRHRRWLPAPILRRAHRAYYTARLEAEQGLPRRYRRALRGERMVPSK